MGNGPQRCKKKIKPPSVCSGRPHQQHIDVHARAPSAGCDQAGAEQTPPTSSPVHPARARQQCLPSAVQRARARTPDESRTMVVPCVAWADRSPPTGTYFLAALQVAPTWVEGRLPHGVTAIALGNPRDERTVSHIHAYGHRRRGPGRSQGNGCAKHETFFFFYYSLAHGGESAVSLDSFIHTIVVRAVGIQKGDPVPDASHDFAA